MQAEFHEVTPSYGISGAKQCEAVLGFCDKLKTRDVLDYGCGKATLQKGLPFAIQNYDPCMHEYAARPKPAVLVCCTDVLEHVEEDCIDAVIADLRSLTFQVLFVNVATRPAKKTLPDGRNAHILQRSNDWWIMRLMAYFDFQSYQTGNGEFTALLTPKKAPDA